MDCLHFPHWLAAGGFCSVRPPRGTPFTRGSATYSGVLSAFQLPALPERTQHLPVSEVVGVERLIPAGTSTAFPRSFPHSLLRSFALPKLTSRFRGFLKQCCRSLDFTWKSHGIAVEGTDARNIWGTEPRAHRGQRSHLNLVSLSSAQWWRAVRASVGFLPWEVVFAPPTLLSGPST